MLPMSTILLYINIQLILFYSKIIGTKAFVVFSVGVVITYIVSLSTLDKINDHVWLVSLGHCVRVVCGAEESGTPCTLY